VSSAVFVLGHRGMLGRVVRRYLAEQGCRVATTDERFAGGSDDPLIEEVLRSGADIVVNCAGAVPSRVTDRNEMLRSNALLPQQLATRLGSGQMLIHASSDGVFDGSGGPYDADEVPDAIDTYGMSKRLGELAMHLTSAIVVRTSIVGTGGGLLGWLLDQHDDVEGYTNHLWSGVTTLEWARVCWELINDADSRSYGIVHVTSQEAVSKHVLLETAAQVFGSPIRVRPTVARQSINRALTPTMQRTSIRAQLVELRDWESSRT
jgi:dTDP-4-dehydrorhamnose reductase